MSHEKDMEEYSLNAHNSVKEASVKRLYAVWFQIYDILEMAKLWRQEKGPWLLGTGGGMNKWITEDI